MEQYLIDTNVVSNYFSELLPEVGMTLIDEAIDATPNLSIITQIELLSWKTDDVAELQVKNFIQDSIIWEVTPDVVIECVRIRRSKKIKTPDAIIAATTLANGFTIITNNEKDFENIRGLKIVNPHKLQEFNCKK
jgi:predicted nucleic acid-binding protein